METKVIVMFAVLHGSAIVLGTCLLVMLARSASGAPPQDNDSSDGGGEGPATPPSPGPVGGGLPLSSSRPARVRLREPIQPARYGPVRA